MIVGEYQNFKTTDNNFQYFLEKDKENIIFTGRLTDIELIKKIKEAQTLILPSLYEGFGIPPMEALYLGTDAIVSDIPALKEIYMKLPVTFFQAGNVKDLANKLIGHKQNTIADFNIARKEIDNKYNFKLTANDILKTIKDNL